MSDVKLTAGTLLVVCDGAKALFLKNVGAVTDPRLETVETFEQPNEPSRALGTDRPGRAFDSTSPGRSAMEETDWHDEAEADFLRSVAERLETIVKAGEAEEVVLVAAPRALGRMRAFLPAAVSGATVKEIAADLTGQPVAEIGRRFAWR